MNYKKLEFQLNNFNIAIVCNDVRYNKVGI